MLPYAGGSHMPTSSEYGQGQDHDEGPGDPIV